MSIVQEKFKDQKTKVALLGKLFFYLLLLSLPFQTRKIFFTSHSYYYGYQAFYNTFYLYLTDLLVLGLILAWLWEKRNFTLSIPQIYKKVKNDEIYLCLCIFWLILAISIIFSRERFLGLYGLAKISEFGLLFAYIRENITPSSILPLKKGEVGWGWLILATFFLQSVLGIIQYLGQSSLGLKIFGEEFLRPGIKGIAEFVSSGVANPLFYSFFPYLSPISKITINIRAYGTFPHPNILGGLLFAGLIINMYLVYSSKFSRERLFLGLSMLGISSGLVVSFSRIAWLVTASAVFVWFLLIFIKIRKPHFLAMRIGKADHEFREYFPERLVLIVFVLLLSFALNYFMFSQQIKDRFAIPLTDEISSQLENYTPQESLAFRKVFNQIALQMIKQKPLFGVGLKNSVAEMDNYSIQRLLPFMHQPVHNIFLLIAAEGGILALIAFVLTLYNIVRHGSIKILEPILRYSLLLIFSGFLIIGFFDHYFWSIQQGSLMFWIILGLLAQNPNLGYYKQCAKREPF